MRPRLLLLLPSNTYRATAFLDAAGRLGADLTVASDHVSVFSEAQPDNLLALDFRDPAAAARRVAEFAQRHPLAAVFGVDDDTAVIAAHIAAALGLRHSTVDACEAARDKHRQRVLMARDGLAVPAFALHRFADDLAARSRSAPYPCVLKPLRLSMSRGVIRADDPEQFVRAAARLREIAADSASPDAFIVEQFVPGLEFALEGVLEDGQLRVLAVFDKPDPLDGPLFAETIYVTPSRLSDGDQQRLALTVGQAADALGLTRGPVHAELRLNAGGVWLIEMAARPIGGRCSSILRFGADAEVSLEELLLSGALKAWERGSAGAWEREDAAAAVYMIPVPRAGTLRSVSGVSDARRLPWVDDVVITAHEGQALLPLPEGNQYLGFIFAWAPSPEEAGRAVRDAHAKLSFELV